MKRNEWSLVSARLPVSVKILAYMIVLLFATAPIPLLFYLPRAPLSLITQVNLSWIIEWTLLEAAASATIAVLVGAPVGIAAGYYGSRPARLYRVLGLPVFMAPSVAVVLGFRWLAGLPYMPGWIARAPWGIIVVHSYFNIPLAAVLVYSSIAGVSREIVDYLESIGVRGWRIWRLLLIPASLRGSLSAWILTFIYSFTGLAAPLMVEGSAYRYYTLEAWIYTIFRGFPSYRILAVLLTLLQAGFLTMVAVLFLRSQFKAAAAELGEATRRPRETGWRLALDAYSTIVLAYLYAPILGVLLMSFTTGRGIGLDNYARLIQGPLPVPPGASFARSILNSIVYASIAVAGSILVSLPLVAGKRRLLGSLAGVSPLVISPVTLGISLYLVYYTRLHGIIGHTPTILFLVGLSHIAMALPLASRAVDSALSRLPGEVLEFMVMVGLKGYRLLTLLARSSGPGLVSAAMLAAASSLGEFGATLVLTEPSTWSLGVLTYNLFGAGRLLGVASASASVLLAMSLALLFLVARNLREWF